MDKLKKLKEKKNLFIQELVGYFIRFSIYEDKEYNIVVKDLNGNDLYTVVGFKKEINGFKCIKKNADNNLTICKIEDLPLDEIYQIAVIVNTPSVHDTKELETVKGKTVSIYSDEMRKLLENKGLSAYEDEANKMISKSLTNRTKIEDEISIINNGKSLTVIESCTELPPVCPEFLELTKWLEEHCVWSQGNIIKKTLNEKDFYHRYITGKINHIHTVEYHFLCANPIRCKEYLDELKEIYDETTICGMRWIEENNISDRQDSDGIDKEMEWKGTITYVLEVHMDSNFKDVNKYIRIYQDGPTVQTFFQK